MPRFFVLPPLDREPRDPLNPAERIPFSESFAPLRLCRLTERRVLAEGSFVFVKPDLPLSAEGVLQARRAAQRLEGTGLQGGRYSSLIRSYRSNSSGSERLMLTGRNVSASTTQCTLSAVASGASLSKSMPSRKIS